MPPAKPSRLRLALVLPALLLPLSPAGGAGGAERESVAPDAAVTRVQACVRRNLPERSSRQAVRFRAVDRLGAARVSQARILWRHFDEGARALVRFNAPEELQGSALLVVQDGERAEMLLYLPDAGRVRRVTGPGVAGAVFGTDFSYEDLARVLGLYAEGPSRRLPDAEEQGREAWVLESRPAEGSGSGYARIVTYVDSRTCVPLRMDFFDANDRPRKLMKVPEQRIERRGSDWLPTLILMKDLAEETYTELIVDEIELDLDISRSRFTESGLQTSPN